MGPALEVHGLGKRLGGAWALRGLTFSLPPGEACALLGANGAGKTTLLRCCATLGAPTEGRVRIAGRDAQDEGPAARRALGFAGDTPRLYGDLTVEENVRFAARFLGAEGRVAGALAAMGLEGRARDRARALSRGWAQRVALARALVGEPALLLLDEPFAALDAAGTEAAQAALAQAQARGAALLMSGQAPFPGAQRALVLRAGALQADLTRPDARVLAELEAEP